MFPNITRDYLFASLRESPRLVARELLPEGDMRWDLRVWEDRFTAREVCAHLADQEEIFQTRFRQVLNETNPELFLLDPSVLCEEREYGKSDPFAAIERLRESRKATLEILGSVEGDQWLRIGRHPWYGVFELQHLAMQILLHDHYHLRQLIEIGE